MRQKVYQLLRAPNYAKLLHELLQAIALACLFGAPLIVYFMDMKP